MIVFKSYFKIVKKHLGLIILFSLISIGIAIANTSYNAEDTYINVDSKVGIINYDDSELTKDFIKYMENNSKIVEVNDNQKDIQDTLYGNKVDAILIIPKNYAKDFLDAKEPSIEIKKSVQSLSESVELLVNKYFKIANIYAKIGMTENEMINRIKVDLEKEIDVKMANGKNTNDLKKISLFYNFENYAFVSIFIFVIGTIMCIFNKETISKRNSISKMNPKDFSKQLFLGHISLTLIIWFIFVVISICLYKELMFNMNGVLLIVNSLIFAITITSFAYLIGTLIKNQNVISGIQNVVSLGTSFISGCFVTTDLLDENVVNFSKLFPSYWFIDGNNKIVKLSTFDFQSLKNVLQNFAIVVLYGLIYFLISRVIIKRKSKK